MRPLNSADYDRFSVVAFASEPVRGSIAGLRRLLPPSGRAIIAPHVTLKGTFVDPVDLDRISAHVRAACEPIEPLEVSLGDLYDYAHGEHASIGFAVVAPAPLADLHRRLVASVEPLCSPLGGSPENPDAYRPHLTVVQQIATTELAAAKETAEAYFVPKKFRLEEAAVMGRRREGGWESLSKVTFGRPSGQPDPKHRE